MGRNNIIVIVYSLKDGNGLIKEFNQFGELIFEGEYLNGKRNGKGKEYYLDGQLFLMENIIMMVNWYLKENI